MVLIAPLIKIVIGRHFMTKPTKTSQRVKRSLSKILKIIKIVHYRMVMNIKVLILEMQ